MPTVGYISTHNDDAILFRGEHLYRDLHTPGTHTTVIVPNCADAGGGYASDWWRAKEQGTVRALAATRDPVAIAQDTVLVNGHDVVRYRGSGWSCWFLRLPDGGLSGEGYPANGGASMTKLAENRIADLMSIDAANSYPDMGNVGFTMRQILLRDGWAPGGWVTYGDPNGALNPGDHADHYAVNNAVHPFLNDARRILWVSYDVRYRAANLGGLPLANKRHLFEHYCYTAGAAVNEDEWTWWGRKSYARVLTP